MAGTHPRLHAPIVGVGAVIFNGRDEVLLIRRAKPPLDGEWSIPGGKVESGETLHDALKREVHEETSLEIEILGLIDVVDTLSHPSIDARAQHYVLIDYAARVTGGELHAGSDAAEARWVPIAALDDHPMWSETRQVIAAAMKAWQ